MDYAADDFPTIAARLRELREERERDNDVDRATGAALDRLGREAGVERAENESDYTYRGRIRAAVKVE